MNDLRLIFGLAVKGRRIKRNVSQEELADLSGLHRTYISDVERGARNLSLESIGKLAKALGLSISKLFELTTQSDMSAGLIEILLIEDDSKDADSTLLAFRKARIANKVHVVSDGAEALQFLFATGTHVLRSDEPLPGVIMLDLNLPKPNGMELLRKIKADKRTQEIAIIVLTASAREHDTAADRKLGIDAYIIKPVGIKNFSEITPHLEMDWALVKSLLP